MKKQLTIPLLAVLGGAAALALRFWQNQTGFEPDSGLPVPGTPAGPALLALLLILAAVFGLLVLRLPKEADPGPSLPGDFPLRSSSLAALLTGGAMLIAVSGLADLYEGISGGNLLWQLRSAAESYELVPAASGLAPRVQLLLGGLALLSAAAMLAAVAACRRGSVSQTERSLLLIPPVGLVVRLVVTYRLDSVNPALSAYYVELLALVFLTLAFYRLSSFAFQAGRTRRFALYAAPAVVLSMAALADGGPHLSSLLLYAGGALFLLGFLVLRLTGPAGLTAESTQAPDSPL